VTFIYRPTCGSIYIDSIDFIGRRAYWEDEFILHLDEHLPEYYEDPRVEQQLQLDEDRKLEELEKNFREWDDLEDRQWEEAWDRQAELDRQEFEFPDRTRLKRWHADGTEEGSEHDHDEFVVFDYANILTSKPFQRTCRGDKMSRLGTNQRQLVGEHELDEDWQPPTRKPKRWARKDNICGPVIFKGTRWKLGWCEILHNTVAQQRSRERRDNEYNDHRRNFLANQCADVLFEEWCRECEREPYVPFDREAWLIAMRTILDMMYLTDEHDDVCEGGAYFESTSPVEQFAIETFRVSDHW